MRFKRR